MSYSIRDCIEALTPTKERGKYVCPVCDGHSLSIGPRGFKCWKGCDGKDIYREAGKLAGLWKDSEQSSREWWVDHLERKYGAAIHLLAGDIPIDEFVDAHIEAARARKRPQKRPQPPTAPTTKKEAKKPSKAKFEPDTQLSRLPELTEREVDEIAASAIDLDLAALNIVSVEPGDVPRWCVGNRRLRYTGALFGGMASLDDGSYRARQFKAVAPYTTAEGSTIKYRTLDPKGTTDWAIIPRVDLATWQRVAARYELELPSDIPSDVSALSVAFWSWVRENKLKVVITEGCKKALSLLTQGFPAIALPGVWMATVVDAINPATLFPRHKLSASLAQFVKCPIAIAFDQDEKISTQRKVSKAISRLGFAAKRSGAVNISVASWDGSIGKGIDDAIANGADARNIIASACEFYFWQSKQSVLLGSRYPDNYRFISRSKLIDKRYIPELELPTAQIVGLKAAMGSGKTVRIAQWLQQWRTANPNGVAIDVTHRNSLGRQHSEKFDIDLHIDDIRKHGGAGLRSFWSCVDSLTPWKFDPMQWGGADQPLFVILDEAFQQAWSWLTTSTHAKDRADIFENLSLLLRRALQHPNSRIVLADELLCDTALMAIEALVGQQIEPCLIEVAKPLKQRRAVMYDDAKEWFYVLIQAAKAGERILIHTAGQKEDSTWGTINLESAIAAECPGVSILRLDSGTLGTLNSDGYLAMQDLPAAFQRYQVIVASPVLETGISLDRDAVQLDKIFGISHGAGAPAYAFRQSIERYRGDCDRHLYVPESAKGKRIGNGATSARQLWAAQDKLAQATLKDCRQFTELADLEYANHGRPGCDLMTVWSRYGSYINSLKNNFQYAIADGLKADGYTLASPATTTKDARKDGLKELLKETKIESCKANSKAVSSARDIDEDTYKSLKSQNVLTRADRLAARKFGVSKAAALEPKDVIPWHVDLDRNDFWKQARWHFELLNLELLLSADISRYGRDTGTADGKNLLLGRTKEFALDGIKKWKTGRAKALQRYGFIDFLKLVTSNKDLVLSQSHPAIVKLGSGLRSHGDDVATQRKIGHETGLYIHWKRKLENPADPKYKADTDGQIGLRAAREFLKSVAIQLKSCGRASIGDRDYLYIPASTANKALHPMDDDRTAFHDRLRQQYTERHEHRLKIQQSIEEFRRSSTPTETATETAIRLKKPYINLYKEKLDGSVEPIQSKASSPSKNLEIGKDETLDGWKIPAFSIAKSAAKPAAAGLYMRPVLADPRIGQTSDFLCADGITRNGYCDADNGALVVRCFADGRVYPIPQLEPVST